MCEYSQSRNYFRRILLFLSFDFLLRKKRFTVKQKKQSSPTQPPLSVILHNQQYNCRNQEINIGRILLILWTVPKFCQFHCKFPCFVLCPIQDSTLHLVFRSPQALLICDSSSNFIFHNCDILEKSVILQNVPQFRFVRCFLMIKLRLCSFAIPRNGCTLSQHIVSGGM